ncbi:MAG: bifunctional phosphopantothenoylcysteine decarboxylase/phosphopantothenate--cysteine ligase CoaBC [Fimbriimonadaceae bacterium]
MSNIVLGVCGSISAYRACDLARDLMRAGHTVRVCLTDSAAQFVTPVLFETLTGNPCLTETFEEPIRGRMAHIDWAREADLVLIAPATANTLNKVANGIGDEMLTTIILAAQVPLVIAPAMNPAMFTNPETQSSITKIQSQGAFIIEPTEGDVASGETGQGKLAPNSQILECVETILAKRELLKDKTILITSGPTQEPIDSVRYITNRSSGKMGDAMARAAKLMGAKVIFITGPTSLPTPANSTTIKVKTADEMLAACQAYAAKADWIIGLAAVADYKINNPSNTKLRRNDGDLTLTLSPNPDIIGSLAKENPTKRVIAFAAEPSDDTTYATEKMRRKGVFAIALNDVSNPEIGFHSDENELTLILSSGESHKSGRKSKLACALWMLEILAQQP